MLTTLANATLHDIEHSLGWSIARLAQARQDDAHYSVRQAYAKAVNDLDYARRLKVLQTKNCRKGLATLADFWPVNI